MTKTTAKTYSAKISEVQREWHVVDADGATLGRLATRIALILRGKHKATFTPSPDTRAPGIALNAAKFKVPGPKLKDKMYERHWGSRGGFRAESLERLLERRPEEVIRRAVRGMLPQNRLGDQMMRKLHIYAGATHPHAAQKPQPL